MPSRYLREDLIFSKAKRSESSAACENYGGDRKQQQKTLHFLSPFPYTKHHMTLVSNLLSPKRVNSNWVRVSPNKGRRKISIKKIKDQTIHLHSCNPETSFPKHLIYFELYNLRIQFVCIFGGIWEWNEEIREENFQKSVGISCILCLLFAYRVAL